MKESLLERYSRWAIVGIVLVICLVTLYPMLYVLLASISDSDRLLAHTGMLWKSYGVHLDAYELVLKNPGIVKGYVNTLLIIGMALVANMLVTAMAAYVLSRKNVFWNKYFMFFILFTMFVNGGLIPFYLVVKGTGLMDSLWSLIVPFLVNTFFLIIMRTVFMTVPYSLEESATIDGAGHMTIFARIVVPLSLPVIAVVALYYVVEKWNGWFYASLFLRDRNLYPLQLILREILITNSTSNMFSSGSMDQLGKTTESIKYATIVIATLPILCLYPFVQRFFEKGVMLGSLKG